MSFLNQANFPGLWLVFQLVVGATRDKQQLAMKHYNGQKRVLEIGCSAGNVSEVFSKFKHIEFTGIDIDDKALAYARKRLGSFKNFKFLNISLSDFAKTGKKFDYVLFANILHHVDDQSAADLLKHIQLLLADDATLIVMDSEKKRGDYNLLFKAYYLLEQGRFRRTEKDLENLVTAAGMTVRACCGVLVSPHSLPFIKVARLTVIEATANNSKQL